MSSGGISEKRTTQQNRALHKLFDQISVYCLENGIDQKTTLDHFQNFETPVTPEFVKTVWQTIQSHFYGTHHTRHMETHQVDRVYEHFARFWVEVTGEDFKFPTVDSMTAEHEKNFPTQEKDSIKN